MPNSPMSDTKLETTERDAWMETAAQHLRNEEYYRSLVVQIGEMLGEAAYISDDGSKQDSVLCAKVPELVRARLRSPAIPAEVGGLIERLRRACRYENPDKHTLGFQAAASNGLVLEAAATITRQAAEIGRLRKDNARLTKTVNASLAIMRAPTDQAERDTEYLIEALNRDVALLQNRAEAAETELARMDAEHAKLLGEEVHLHGATRVALSVAEAEASRLRAKVEEAGTHLRDVRDNGLIYWEPQTGRGRITKGQMLSRIDAFLATIPEGKETTNEA